MIKKRTPIAVIPEPRNQLSFGFKDLRDISYTKAKNDSDYFVDFIQHLRKFCALNWNDIRTTQRHGLGTESIDVASLKDGAKVDIAGFGKFEVKTRAARTGINPQTKETIEIPSSKVPGFKASKSLKDYVR